MKKEDWQTIKQIFDDALAVPAIDRSAFLDSAAGSDSEIRIEVERLLTAYESGFLEDTAMSAAAEALIASGLTTGQVVGRYKIAELIGTGGMGEVFRADDAELDRSVAFKVLHRDVAEDEERVRRFIQEARAASALNHPNILTIHEIGTFERSRFIVSEYVDGETLREKMHDGLTTPQSVDITCQIAAALQAAHSAGIVHRDIKPENVMIRKDGLVKVLDFGLAKLTEADDLPLDASAPLSRIHTSPGLVMGTVAYMSPEQAKGQPVDARTDLWSLGVVLHEMLTGSSPFEGDSVTELISSIIKKDTSPAHLETLPSELRPICQKALAKDKDSRYRSAHDLLKDLEGEKKRMEYAIHPTPYISSSGTDDLRTQLIRPRPTLSADYIVTSVKQHKNATVVLAVLIVTTAIALSVYRFNGATPRDLNFHGVIDASTTEQDLKITRFAGTGRVLDIAISPDGRFVAYVTGRPIQGAIHINELATQKDREILPAPTGDREAILGSLVFTPDGGRILYRNDAQRNGDLYSISVTGGAPVKIGDKSGAASASPDGKTIAYYKYLQNDEHKWQGTDLVLADSDGTNPRVLVHTPSATSWIETDVPAWSADGKWIAAWQHFVENGEGFYKLYAINASNGSRRDFGDRKWGDISSSIWMPDGSLVICAQEYGSPAFSSEQIWRVNETSSKVITSDANGFDKLSGTSDGRMLAAVQKSTRRDLWLTNAGEASTARQITFSGDLSESSRFSSFPDGRLVITSIITGSPQLWRINADGSGRRQLTEKGFSLDPYVSPDGHFIVFSSDGDSRGVGHLYRMNPDGTDVKKLTDQDYARVIGISADNKWVYYRVMQKEDTGRVYKVPADGGASTFLAKTDSNGRSYEVSSSVGRIAETYTSEDGKLKEIRIYSPGSTEVKHIALPFTAAGGGPIHWTPDGRSIVFRDTRNAGANLYIVRTDEKSAPSPLTNFAGLGATGDCIWSHDGKQLIVSRSITTWDGVLITNARETLP